MAEPPPDGTSLDVSSADAAADGAQPTDAAAAGTETDEAARPGTASSDAEQEDASPDEPASSGDDPPTSGAEASDGAGKPSPDAASAEGPPVGASVPDETPTDAAVAAAQDGGPSGSAPEPGRGVRRGLGEPNLRGRAGTADAAFRGVTLGAGIFVLLIMTAIAAFLLSKAIPAINADHGNFITDFDWGPDNSPSHYGIAALAYGTLITSVIALLVAVPVAVGVALFLSQYVQRINLLGRSYSLRWLSQTLGYVIDLLAAVPSVVYGLWGLFFLNDPLITASRWLSDHLSFIPLFASSNGTFGQSVFVASILLAVMILPIICAISREIFLQTPPENKEAALALGATRWEMIRLTVLPYGRSGVVSASVLGLGRALGETIAVALVLSSAFKVSARILDPGGNTIAANIANYFQDAQKTGQGALIASGLVLFAITLLVNFVARAITRKARAVVV